jgi:hypothetical protein
VLFPCIQGGRNTWHRSTSFKQENKIFMRIKHFKNVTLRAIESEKGKISRTAWNIIQNTALSTLKLLKINNKYLFITILDSCSIQINTSKNFAHAIYQSKIQHIVICAGKINEMSKEEWEYNLKIHTIHEIIHFWQELNGKLGNKRKTESEANRLSKELMAKI